jgi:hypothetical protein
MAMPVQSPAGWLTTPRDFCRNDTQRFDRDVQMRMNAENYSPQARTPVETVSIELKHFESAVQR